MPPAGVPPHAPTPAGITLTDNVHGKARVRVAKSTRPATPDGHATWAESSVGVLLRGGADAAFTDGDNSGVVSTDTVKNVVYVVAGRHPTTPPESFALAIAATFLAEYPHVGGADVTVTQPTWTRVVADGVAHPHGFLGGAGTRTAAVSLERGGVPAVSGGLAGVRVLKTTASGWAGFHAGRYSTLPPTDDRVLCTDVTAEWRFAGGWGAAGDELATTRGGRRPPTRPPPTASARATPPPRRRRRAPSSPPFSVTRRTGGCTARACSGRCSRSARRSSAKPTVRGLRRCG
ncbi:hypothetical protein BU14_0031s0066 [Porphyra umbilicalis]|uniref:Uricase n=1 Tax=Porphyra umbilicalis TaxID=2786 RepID=A0A1X6PJG8_PORUM|nr:hypothetical protein BU14_0031s0066 [Porphyra umbilicalis]|eukprot:OSX80896.1 hypothetical protein BU14_0031s0066 [Porphyra umbilicalis]